MPNRKLPLSSNPEWVALPSDPNTPFTPEQDAAFYSPNATRFLRDMVLAASRDVEFMRHLAPSQPQPYSSTPAPAVREKAVPNAS